MRRWSVQGELLIFCTFRSEVTQSHLEQRGSDYSLFKKKKLFGCIGASLHHVGSFVVVHGFSSRGVWAFNSLIRN